MAGIQHLDVLVDDDVAGLDFFGPLHLDADGLLLLRVHPEEDFLEVEDDVGDVLGNVGDGGELVLHAFDADAGHGGALQRAEQHAPQRVAEGDAEAALDRLGDDLHLQAGDVDLAVVDAEVPVPDELARLRARVGETEAEDHVVEALLEELEQVLAGLALGGAAAQVVAAELRLEQAVEPLHLLLLAQLHAVFGELGAALAVLARRIRAALDGALVRVAAVALQVHLEIFTPADAARRFRVSSHLEKAP